MNETSAWHVAQHIAPHAGLVNLARGLNLDVKFTGELSPVMLTSVALISNGTHTVMIHSSMTSSGEWSTKYRAWRGCELDTTELPDYQAANVAIRKLGGQIL